MDCFNAISGVSHQDILDELSLRGNPSEFFVMRLQSSFLQGS